MTFSQFEQELYLIQANQKAIASIRISLDAIDEKYLSKLSSGAMDYSQDRLQSSKDPDASLVNTLWERDEERKDLLKKIEYLKGQCSEVRSLLWQANGIGGEILRLFFLECMEMDAIAERLKYDRSTCYKFRRIKQEELYRQYESKEVKRNEKV